MERCVKGIMNNWAAWLLVLNDLPRVLADLPMVLTDLPRVLTLGFMNSSNSNWVLTQQTQQVSLFPKILNNENQKLFYYSTVTDFAKFLG